uniref:exodeoxyribonuclease III n=1 Tax=Scleropages formosus TaxID=113540 RepID=A0A8C9R1H5_SCLFO
MEDFQRTLNILSWNVNGFLGKKSSVLDYFKLTKPDIIFLQETHLGPSKHLPPGSIKLLEFGPDYNMAVFNVYKANSRGVAVLFRRDLCCEGLRVIQDKNGRYLIIQCTVEGQDFVFVNVYNPIDEKIEFMNEFDLLIKPFNSSFIVMGGDFNTVLETELDKTSRCKNRGHRERLRDLAGFLKKYDLVDVWRCLHPEEKSFTYFGMGQKGNSRLDYFFIPVKVLRTVTACEVHARPQYSGKEGYISDHAPTSIQICTENKWWQLDRSLLWDENLVAHFSNTIKTFSKKKTKRKAELWMGLKFRLRCEEKAYKRKMNGERRERKKARVQVRCQGHLTEDGFIESLSVFQKKHFQGYSGPTSNFGTHQIAFAYCKLDLQDYLDKLYTAQKLEELQYTINCTLMEQITKIEILTTILSLPDSSLQTPDGLPVQFYQQFACQLTDYLHAVFDQILNLEPLKLTFSESFTQKHAVPGTAPSQLPSQDHTYCNSNTTHSVVSQFNIDYIIFSSVLAGRLNNISGHLLNPGKGRSASLMVESCIRAFQNALENQKPLIVVTLKMNPNGIKWPYLFQRLKGYNLPVRFQHVLKSLVTKGKSCNEDFHLSGDSSFLKKSQTRGLQLGCPLTPVLLSFSLQPLIKSIHDEERLQGVEVEGQEVKALADSDTALIFLTNPCDGLQIFEDILTDFTANSGLTVNENFSEMFVFSIPEYSLDSEKMKCIKRTSNGFCYHGCFISPQSLIFDGETVNS